MRKIAIFGGTFNPVHCGHLLIAETALNQFELAQVIWVPTYSPPHKGESWQLFDHRLEMVRRAIAGHPAFTVTEIESRRQGVSYAISTLTDLQTLYPNAQWFWIIGIDAFQSLPKWRESKTLAVQCTWLVAPRNLKDEGKDEDWGMGNERNSSAPISHLPSPTSQALCQQVANNITPSLRWHLLEMPEIGISSSLIRQACREGRSIRDQVPEAVRLYILEFKLYAK
ncbi:MAG: nicotinate (nicotinamide) nucleotide adenylyltransferase [Kovacikia sp.]